MFYCYDHFIFLCAGDGVEGREQVYRVLLTSALPLKQREQVLLQSNSEKVTQNGYFCIY